MFKGVTQTLCWVSSPCKGKDNNLLWIVLIAACMIICNLCNLCRIPSSCCKTHGRSEKTTFFPFTYLFIFLKYLRVGFTLEARSSDCNICFWRGRAVRDPRKEIHVLVPLLRLFCLKGVYGPCKCGVDFECGPTLLNVDTLAWKNNWIFKRMELTTYTSGWLFLVAFHIFSFGNSLFIKS